MNYIQETVKLMLLGGNIIIGKVINDFDGHKSINTTSLNGIATKIWVTINNEDIKEIELYSAIKIICEQCELTITDMGNLNIVDCSYQYETLLFRDHKICGKCYYKEFNKTNPIKNQ